MLITPRLPPIATLAILAAALSFTLFTSQPSAAEEAAKQEPATAEPAQAKAKAKPKLDRSGRKRVGKASIYSEKFAGQKMADGNEMDLQDDNAASKTLPLGTKAKVINLETGQSAKITIQDRGPFVDGRIVDLSPSTAEEIGLSKKEGIAPVEVVPLEVPMPDGSVKPGKPPG